MSNSFARPFVPTVVIGALAFTLLAVAGNKPPVIDSVEEARDPVTNGSMVVLKGKNWRKARSAELFDAEGASLGTLGGVIGKKGASFRLPPGLEPGDYDLVIAYGKKGATTTVATTLQLDSVDDGSVTRDTLDPDLSGDLDDAGRVDGQRSTFYRDATNLANGALAPDRFAAFEDLEAQQRVDEDGQLSTDTFSAEDDLVVAGVVDGSRQVVPDHYSAFADLQVEGRIDGNGDVPGSLFSAWSNLGFRGDRGPGAGSVALGDHDHAGQHLEFPGGDMTGGLEIPLTGSNQQVLTVTVVYDTPVLVDIENTTTGSGVALEGVLPGSDGSFQAGVFGSQEDPNTGFSTGVLGVSLSADGVGVWGSGPGAGVYARISGTTTPAFGVEGRHEAGGTAVHIEVDDSQGGSGGLGLNMGTASTTGDYMEMRTLGTTVARVDGDGQGLFNGGIATSGADIAESVAVATDAAGFQSGDVLVIDRSAARTFGLAATARSRLVAGVVSTKPALVGSLHDVAALGLPADEVVLGVAGIVPTKVSAENGPIRAGDLLVTASIPGHAMRADDDPAAGTVLGKALGALGKGTGVVEVLLSMK